MSKAATSLSTGQTIKWNTENTPTVYANILAFGMSPFDISLMFGELGDSDGTNVTAHGRVKILLSPEQAANLIKLATAALNVYTKTNGAIRTSGAVDVDNLASELEKQKIKVV